jgi:hypothetical protein
LATRPRRETGAASFVAIAALSPAALLPAASRRAFRSRMVSLAGRRMRLWKIGASRPIEGLDGWRAARTLRTAQSLPYVPLRGIEQPHAGPINVG